MKITLTLESDLNDHELISKVLKLAKLPNYFTIKVDSSNLIKLLKLEPKLDINNLINILFVITTSDVSIEVISQFVEYTYIDLAKTEFMNDADEVYGDSFSLWNSQQTVKAWMLLHTEAAKYLTDDIKSKINSSLIIQKLDEANTYSKNDSHFEVNKVLVDSIKINDITPKKYWRKLYCLIALYCREDNYQSFKYFYNNFIQKITDNHSSVVSMIFSVCLVERYFAFIENVILGPQPLCLSYETEKFMFQLTDVDQAMFFIDLYQSGRIEPSDSYIRHLLEESHEKTMEGKRTYIDRILAIVFQLEAAEAEIGKLAVKCKDNNDELLNSL